MSIACTLSKCRYICGKFRAGYVCKPLRRESKLRKFLFIDFMATDNKKRRLITSFHNLTAEQQAEVKALYPLGFTEVMSRFDKPDGSFFYTVPYETEDTYYMVKIDVKVDDGQDDDNDGYYDDDDLKGADELADASDEVSDDDF